MIWGKGYNREHFLADLVNKHGLKKTAELGIWKGRTFLHMLLHCPNTTIIGVDAWKVRPENKGVPGGETYERWDMKTFEGYVRDRSKVFGDRAIIIKANTDEAAAQVEDGSLDLVFIDADHSEAGVRNDIKNWVPKVRKGGFVTGHDIDWPTVVKVVQQNFRHHSIGPDNVWWVQI